ncbi:PSD1 and planctomycete cytochrome C domain-containing protein [Allorhodopirellula solitaria]|uniref:Planctomycete cytochrome C n=1 Tax=Allorhodopirellula solitaria TaxID=2527987 RepID=A0A5C5YJG5_9BACT|nr:PSD1 and planctomycete cytochrome C domain-containing protein [Allorhodopirellula solitaria]TWT75025.1 Planctomycete cytochrome C [Allorhodopirellula solitaria]
MNRSLLTLTFVLFAFCPSPLPGDEINFEDDVLPILENNCLYCHGEDEQESGLRLDRRGMMLRGGDSGLAAVVPGHPEKSYLVQAINHVDEGMSMPPDEDKIPAEEIELITRWIQEGAQWPGQMDDVVEEEIEHWAFLPRKREFDHDTIDGFLHQRLADAGLDFSPSADPRSLIRRAAIVLTGLAPTPERTRAFITDFENDGDAAYESLVDELLASPHFGQRWAQHWLDVIRWAETNGSESNLYRKNAWMYRDYVVSAFNDDKPYDQFIREQLAGDKWDIGQATGFLVAGPHVPSATVGSEPSARRQARADRLDEVLQTVGASMMGMTIGCARCHNHKFDPLSIQDYYSLTAVFQDVEFGSRYPERADDDPRVQLERELRGKLADLRREMLARGYAWTEDWKAYQEVHFPQRSVDRLRISFLGRFVLMDEVEILQKDPDAPRGVRNIALPSLGLQVEENPATKNEGMTAENLVNQSYGAKEFKATSPKGSAERPWVNFGFAKAEPISRIRLSSDREDFLETDYIKGLMKIKYGDFQLEVADESKAGAEAWKPFCTSAGMKRRAMEDTEYNAIQTQINNVISQLIDNGPQPAFVARFVDPVETFVLARGSPESPYDRVYASAPARFDGDLGIPLDGPGPQRRAAFAKWLVDPENPLTARVMVNRLWHHIFGSGIVATPSDFGRAGAMPTHPELLDWMAARFIDSEYSMKAMIRSMVMSRAFRQSSQPNAAALEKDATAQLLWRFPPRRVEAEVIRDSVLLASGRLDDSLGGLSYRIHNEKKRYAQWKVVDNYGEETWRRMLYQERMRRVDDRMFTAFDFPDCGQIRAKRPVSTTPLQALNLMNSDFIVTQARLIAQRARQKAGDNLREQVGWCFQLLLTREPSDDERNAAVEFVQSESLELLCRTLVNTNEFAFLP